jgi:hypothetical protein
LRHHPACQAVEVVDTGTREPNNKEGNPLPVELIFTPNVEFLAGSFEGFLHHIETFAIDDAFLRSHRLTRHPKLRHRKPFEPIDAHRTGFRKWCHEGGDAFPAYQIRFADTKFSASERGRSLQGKIFVAERTEDHLSIPAIVRREHIITLSHRRPGCCSMVYKGILFMMLER